MEFCTTCGNAIGEPGRYACQNPRHTQIYSSPNPYPFWEVKEDTMPEELGICDNNPNLHTPIHTCQNWHIPSDEERAKIKTALTTKSQELGRTLLADAQKKYMEARQETVTAEVTRIIEAKDAYEAQKHKADLAIDFYNRKLAALDAGEFEIAIGPAWQGKYIGGIKFNEEELNRPNY